MKKGKLLSSIVSLCFALAVLTFGVFAAQQVNYTLSGQISYEVNDAYVEVQTAIYKSVIRLDYEGLYHACKNAEEVSSVGGSVSGLSLVRTSSVWSSLSGNQSTYDFDSENNLAFSTESGQQAYAYIFVINVKNLSSDVNVWAVMADNDANYTQTFPTNTLNYSNEVQTTIGLKEDSVNNKNIVVGLALDDVTTNITPTENVDNFIYKLKIGSGDLSQQSFNKEKLTFTYNTTTSSYKVKGSNLAKSVVVIPSTHTQTVSDADVTADVTEIEAGDNTTPAMENCSTIILSDSITTIGEKAFNHKSGNLNYRLINLVLKGSFVSLPSYMCRGCVELVEVHIPSTVLTFSGSYTSEKAFEECSGLLSVEYSRTTANYEFVDGDLIILSGDGSSCPWYNDGMNPLIVGSVTYQTPASVTSIPSSAFRDCYNMKSVTIPSTVQSIESYAFYCCYALENVILPTALTSIGESAFQNCRNLNGIILPNGLSSIGKCAFMSCGRLESITIPSLVTTLAGGYKRIGGFGVFVSCSSLREVIFADDIQLTTLTSTTFRGCTSLKSIKIPSSIISIQSSTFLECVITNVIIDSVYAYTNATSTSACGGLLNSATTVRVLASIVDDANNTNTWLNGSEWTKSAAVDGYYTYTKN